MTTTLNKTAPTPAELEETRVHILVAGRELLLAAKGALKFCSQYVETSSKSSPHLARFFKKAIAVADDLSVGLRNMDTIKRAAGAAFQPIFTALENELASGNIPEKMPVVKSAKTTIRKSSTRK